MIPKGSLQGDTPCEVGYLGVKVVAQPTAFNKWLVDIPLLEQHALQDLNLHQLNQSQSCNRYNKGIVIGRAYGI